MIMQTMKLRSLIITLLLPTLMYAQSLHRELDYYLPETQYDQNIPSPEDYLGFQVGEWHLSHDQLVGYLKLLAQKSDRVQLTEYARSYEQRPLIFLTISSSSNLQNLEFIKDSHYDLSIAHRSSQVLLDSLPAIIYQGYSIHGNESSGANAAALVAYWLAAGQSELVQKTLKELVIMIDPCLNPDGLNRFASWVNSHKHHTLVSDKNDREYHEHWPRGRTNHYWFDLNRDWLLLTHPESRGRIKLFQEWHPVVLTDHHEMGTNSTFFFQPGVPSRTNPLTEPVNQLLTEEIAEYHMEALDSIGSDYFTKERFDDFYYGKGSTYPDVQGCIGILFEQASARGHYQESTNGILDFPFTIRNQVITSLSTQKAAFSMKRKLFDNKKNFYTNTAKIASKFPIKGYRIQETDRVKLNTFIEILTAHQIKVYASKQKTSTPTVIIPTQQKQHKLIRSIFEEEIKFRDSVFYDVSTWNFQHAFDINTTPVLDQNELDAEMASEITEWRTEISSSIAGNFYFNWNQYNAPAFAYALMEDSLAVLHCSVIEGQDVMLAVPTVGKLNTINQLSEEWSVELKQMPRAKMEYLFSKETIELPKVAVIVGHGINSYDAGHHWFQLDYRWGMKVTMIDKLDLPKVDLDRYTTIIMPHGEYKEKDFPTESLALWVEEGGNLVLLKKAIEFGIANQWITLDQKLSSINPENQDGPPAPGSVLGGAIYDTKVNKKHPLCFGYDDSNLAVFKKGVQFYQLPVNTSTVALQYENQNPRLSGYSNENHIDRASGALAAASFGKGKGTIVTLVDNPNFRGYWYGGSKLFANSLFLSNQYEVNQLKN